MTPDTNECWILGIESSCDETALALLRTRADGSELLSERLASQTPLHSRYGGVVPEVAARAHSETLPLLAAEVLAEARQQAKAPERKPDLVAATLGPGLVGGLAAGAVFARALSWAWNAALWQSITLPPMPCLRVLPAKLPFRIFCSWSQADTASSWRFCRPRTFASMAKP